MGGAGRRAVVSDEEEGETEHVNAEDVDDENDEEEEEDEEGQDEYEKDGFIVDDVEEEEEEAEDEGKSQKKKKKKKRLRDSEKNFVLDEEDYDLLEDNISGFHRPKMASTKFKRLKKAGRDTEKGVFRSIFDDDEQGIPPDDIAEEDETPTEVEGDIGEEDEMADFIVDEEEETEIGRAPTRQRKQKKKTLNQISGVSMAALAEAQDIFGDVDELLERRKQGLSRSGMSYDSERGKKPEDEYEPSILVEKYLTEKDEQIRQIDLPERMQMSMESTGPPPVDERSLGEESFWIHRQLPTIQWICQKRDTEGTDEGCLLNNIKKEDIMTFLKLNHVDKCDIPFIAAYRKEQCLSLLKEPDLGGTESEDTNKAEGKPRLKWHKLLWAIKDLDRKWLLLQKRKSVLDSYYNQRYEAESHRIYDEARLSLNWQLFESITKSLKNADSEREVDDVDLKFNLHFPPGEVGVDEGQFKRPKKKSQYSICSKAGLWEIAGKFGPNSEQFGLQITLEKVNMEVAEDLKESPEEIASNFTCALFETPESVLKGARHMAATEISCEPCFRKHVRSIFMDKAEVSTNPTLDGNKAIDSFHQYARVKWLRDKPLPKFEDAQWLLIERAEQEKLIQVTLKLPENILNKLMDEANVCYLSDGVSKSARLWNEQRKLILHDAFSKFLLPSMEKEARAMLTAKAKNCLAMEYGKQLWSKISVAPYHPKGNKVGPDEESAPRVMACCWGPGNPPTTCVMLDSSGEVVDVLSVGSLNLRPNNVNNKQRKENDQQRFLKFMTDHQPHVVVLGAANLSCNWLKENIYEIIFKMVEENPRDVGQDMDGINIYFGDESLPRVYEYSPISSCQLPRQSGIIKRAVALGRYLQNPLAMVANLCGAGREIVSWKLGSLEHFLTSDEKYDIIEQIMVDVTNQVGIDINLAASHDWLFAPLQFVSGLGPRKAVSLQRALVKSGAVRNRKELTGHGLGKRNVFINAVGFLRVRSSGLMASSGDYIDLLDDTRIHPESYGLAKVLAKTVFAHYGQDDEDDELAIEYVRNNQGQLQSVDIDLYAHDNGMLNKIETLHSIKLELLHGFQDWRKPYIEPTPDEAFYMISGENEYTLAEGRTVHVTVRQVQLKRAFCVLDSGLTGVLSKEDYINEGDDFELPERLHEGDTLSCKIKNVERNRYQVFLTCKDSRKRRQVLHDVDPYYHEDGSKLSCQQNKDPKGKDLTKNQFMQRMIVHPHFQNMIAEEAIEFLSDKGAGASVIRPSSRGPFYLTLTLKVYNGVYAHKDITEGGKDHMDITSLPRIGKSLKIGDETFEDLDEVMERYVDPLVTHLKTMLSYRKFRTGTKAEVDEILRVEKSDYPKRIVYGFGISYEHPGTFILTYIRSTNPHHEYVGLYPKGFKFRKRIFDNIDRLVAYFQKHIDDLQHMPPPSVPSAVAAMVPMRSPASLGGGWESDNIGWRDDKSSSTPDNRGRNDWTAGGSGRGGRHPSGLPNPFGGGGRGRGRGSNDGYSDKSDNEREDLGCVTTSTWQSDLREGGGSDNGWSKFPGSKVQNSPAREAFPSGQGSNESGDAGGANWGSGSRGGWGSSSTDVRATSGNWGGGSTSVLGSGGAGGGNWGGGSSSGLGSGSADGDSSGGNWGRGSTSVLGSGAAGGGNWGSGSNRGWGSSSADGGATGGNWGGGSTSALGSGGAGGGNWGGGSSGGWGSSSIDGGASGGNWGGGNSSGSTKIKDSDFGMRGSHSKEMSGSDDGWSKFPGSKVQNSPGREAFPGGWGSGGVGTSSKGNWGVGGGGNEGGWGSWNVNAGSRGDEQGRGRGWGSGRGWGNGNAGGGSQGGWSAGGGGHSDSGGQGCGRGRGRGCGRDSSSYYGRGDRIASGSNWSGSWGGGSEHGGGDGRGRGRARGRGRGRGDSNINDRKDSNYSSNSKWGSVSNEGGGGGWSSGWGEKSSGGRGGNTGGKRGASGNNWGGVNGGTTDSGLAAGNNETNDNWSGGWGGSTGGKSAGGGGSCARSNDGTIGSGWAAGNNNDSKDKSSGGWSDKNSGAWGCSTEGKSAASGGSSWGGGNDGTTSGSGWAAGNKDSTDKGSGGWGGSTVGKSAASGGNSWSGGNDGTTSGSGWAAGNKDSTDKGSGGWGGSTVGKSAASGGSSWGGGGANDGKTSGSDWGGSSW